LFLIVYILVKDKRWEGGNMIIHDDSVSALISHAIESRLKDLIEQIKSIAQQRETLSIQVEVLFEFFFSFLILLFI
jgi:hypothetical protein